MFEDPLFRQDARPLFVMGVPRSGTTALQQLVNAHPQIVVTDELRVVAWLCQETHKLSQGFQEHGNPYPFNEGEAFSEYLTRNAGTLIRPFYKQVATRLGKKDIRYWGDKYPHYDEVLHRLPAMFPRARYLMIHRDLRDVIVSLMKGHAWDVQRASTYAITIYRRYIEQIKKLEDEGLLDDGSLMHVSYDIFVADETDEAKRIFEWLGLGFAGDLQQEIEKLQGTQSHSIRRSTDKPVKFNAQKAVGSWKSALTPEDLSIAQAAIEDVRVQLDFATESIQRQYVRPNSENSSVNQTG